MGYCTERQSRPVEIKIRILYLKGSGFFTVLSELFGYLPGRFRKDDPAVDVTAFGRFIFTGDEHQGFFAQVTGNGSEII